MQHALFLDRDGVVNRRIIDGYVRTWKDFEFLADVFTVLPRAHAAGMLVIVITNQRGIARGLMSEQDLAEIHDRMQGELMNRTGHRFDAIYHCPHERDAGCACRKPLPGMLFDAARDWPLELASSWMVGDSESDIEAGRAAGCRTIRIAAPATATRADFLQPTLIAAWEEIAELGSR